MLPEMAGYFAHSYQAPALSPRVCSETRDEVRVLCFLAPEFQSFKSSASLPCEIGFGQSSFILSWPSAISSLLVSMFGRRCDLLPVARSPIIATSGSLNTPFFWYSHQSISVSTSAFPQSPQARSILKVLSSLRGARILNKSRRHGFVVLQDASFRRNPLLVSMMICPVAETEGKALVSREKLSLGNTDLDGHVGAQNQETSVFLSHSPSFSTFEDGRLHQIEKDASLACLENGSESAGNMMTMKEMRREKISKNKGRIPWNKGKKHLPETIELIRRRTSQALLRPAVREKLIRSASKPMGDAIKESIKRSLLNFHEKRIKLKLQQRACLEDWKNQVAEAARRGGEEELQWNSYSMIAISLRLEYMKELRAFDRMKKQEFKGSAQYSNEHRKSISDAIKEKWKDPEYRSRALMGRQKYLERLKSEVVNIKNSKATGHASKKIMVDPELQLMQVNRKAAAQSMETAYVGKVKRGEARPISRKKSLVVNGPENLQSRSTEQLNSTLADSFKTYMSQSVLPLTEEKTITYGQYLNSSANGQSMGAPIGHGGQFSQINSGKVCSYIDFKASEKLEKLRKLQASRLAEERARRLMMEAEKAAKALEVVAGYHQFAKASLDETRRLLAQAAHSIRSIGSKRMIEQAPRHPQKAKLDDLETQNLSCTNSLPIPKESCMPSESDPLRRKVKPGLSSNNNALVDPFDLVDSWIFHENPEASRKSPSKSLRNVFRPEKHSVLESTPGDDIAVHLTNFSDESSSCTLDLQNLKGCPLMFPKSISDEGGGRNWTIHKNAKGLKMWHRGRLLALENEGYC